MALIKCDECTNEVSSNADSCPHCGNPIAKLANKKTKNRVESKLLVNSELNRHKTNHILHLLLSLFGGIWTPVWVIVTMNDTNARNVIRKKQGMELEFNIAALIFLIVFFSIIGYALIQ